MENVCLTYSMLGELSKQVAMNMNNVYNEASLQLELTIALRTRLGTQTRVTIERNVNTLHVTPPPGLVKRDIDIMIETSSYAVAAELKFPRNGQYPEQMFAFCRDILFLEQLVLARSVTAGFAVFLADDSKFWQGPDNSGIYAHFRNGRPIEGLVCKPTGKRDEELNYVGTYHVTWQDIGRNHKLAIIEVPPT